MTVASRGSSFSEAKGSGEKPTDDCKITRSGNNIQFFCFFLRPLNLADVGIFALRHKMLKPPIARLPAI